MAATVVCLADETIREVTRLQRVSRSWFAARDGGTLVIDDVHELGSTEALQQLRLLVVPRPAGHQVTGLPGSEVTAAAVTSAGAAVHRDYFNG